MGVALVELVPLDPAARAQARAVLPAVRSERQREHHRVPQRRFEVEELTVEPPCLVLVGRLVGAALLIGEQLLKVDLEHRLQRLEAAAALPGERGLHIRGDEHALHHRFQAEVEVELGTFGHTDHIDPETLGRRDTSV